VLSDDLLTCPHDRIRDITALVTVVGGTVVHEREAAAHTSAG
jgi:predicted amidohydrolase YtcJ